MNCFGCARAFDNLHSVPRLLIECGHSLCSNCIQRLYNNGAVTCPDCHTPNAADSVNLYPKNLALLHLKSVSEQHKETPAICSIHSKPIQAFCDKDKSLLCVNCILDNTHKNHPVEPLETACGKERERLVRGLSQLDHLVYTLQSRLNVLQDSFQQALSIYNDNQEKVDKFFSELRKIITNEEEQVKSKFKQQFSSFTSKHRSCQENYLNLLQELDLYQVELLSAKDLPNVPLLENFRSREQIFEILAMELEEPVYYSGTPLNRNSVCEAIAKQIEKLKVKEIKEQQQPPHKQPIAVAIKKGPTSIMEVIRPKKPASYKENGASSSGAAARQAVAKKQVAKKEPVVTASAVFSRETKKAISIKQAKETPSSGNSNNYNISPSPTLDRSQISPINNVSTPFVLNRADLPAICIEENTHLFKSFLSSNASFILDKNRYLYVFGGFSEESNNVIRFNLNTYSWEYVCDMSNRSKFGIAVVRQNQDGCYSNNILGEVSSGAQIIMLGGKKDKLRVGDLETMDIQRKQWTKGDGLEEPRSGFGMVTLNDQSIVLVGGNDGDQILSTVLKMNPKLVSGGYEWKTLSSLNQKRDELAATVGRDGRIYAIGGFGGHENACLRSVERYDWGLQRWEFVKPMSTARRALSAATLADGIYAIGGFDGTNYLSSVEKYDQFANTWVTVAKMNQARCTHSSIALFDSQEIYVFGGFDFAPLETVEKYNAVQDVWEEMPRMPGPRFMHGCVYVCDTME